MKSSDSDKLLQVEWYETEEDYLNVIAMLPASEQQDAKSFDALRAETEDLEKRYREKGFTPRHIPIIPDTIKAWCKANGYSVCKVSIVHFAAESLAIIQEESN